MSIYKQLKPNDNILVWCCEEKQHSAQCHEGFVHITIEDFLKYTVKDIKHLLSFRITFVPVCKMTDHIKACKVRESKKLLHDRLFIFPVKQLPTELEAWDSFYELIKINKNTRKFFLAKINEADLYETVEIDRADVLTNAKRFVFHYGENTLFDTNTGVFWLWDGRVWTQDSKKIFITKKAIDLVEEIENEYKMIPFLTDRIPKLLPVIRKLRYIEDTLALVEGRDELWFKGTDFDSQTNIINLENGVLNLVTKKLSPHHKHSYNTKIAPVSFDPDDRCPRFLDFIEIVTGGDDAYKGFLQTLMGYMLSGNIEEKAFYFLFGPGDTGKTTFLELLKILLGNSDYNGYSVTTRASIFTKDKNIQNEVWRELARARGSRLLACDEFSASEQLNEELIKSLTGGDMVTARQVFEKATNFTPRFKVILQTNNVFDISNLDDPTWNRITILPFKNRLVSKDKKFLTYIKRHELSGILNWALEGYQNWLNNGLIAVPAVSNIKEDFKNVGLGYSRKKSYY